MRPMTSLVNWAVLGLVIERASYGYELVKRFERKFGDVLALSSESHIYTALNELARRGLVEQAPAQPALPADVGRQPRPHYHATADGERRYEEWLIAQIHQDERRSRLFVRQLSVLAHDPDAALHVVERYEQACLEGSRDAPIASRDDSCEDARGELIARLISEESRLVGEAMLAWVEYARTELEALARDRGGSR